MEQQEVEIQNAYNQNQAQAVIEQIEQDDNWEEEEPGIQ